MGVPVMQSSQNLLGVVQSSDHEEGPEKKPEKVATALEKLGGLKTPALHPRFTRRNTASSQARNQNGSQLYNRARYYDPTTGEFTSRDPLEYVDGMSMMRGYMALAGMDPTGLACIECRCRYFNVHGKAHRWVKLDYYGKASSGCEFICPGTWIGKWRRCDASPDDLGKGKGYFYYLTAWENPTPGCDSCLHKWKWRSVAVAATSATAAAGVWFHVVRGGSTFSVAVTRHATEKGFNVSHRVGQGHWLRGTPSGVCRIGNVRTGFWNCWTGIPIRNAAGAGLTGPGVAPKLIPKHPCLSAAIEALLRGLR